MPEKFEPNIYRDSLAEQLKEVPKEERSEFLEQAKGSPKYWEARNRRIEARQNEEEIDDGLGVFLKNKTLYRGSGDPGGKRDGLKIAEDNRSTVGEGMYFTSQAKDATSYAYERSTNSDKIPVVYECLVENIKLLDLRKDENVKKILPEFSKILRKLLSDPKWALFTADLWSAIDNIEEGKVGSGNLQQGVHVDDALFTEYVKNLGYDGLVTLEGGEWIVKEHDTYLIFDPKKVKVVKEKKIKNVK
jgi:hypothetical protein